MCNTFAEWKESVKEEWRKLDAVADYLNYDGQQRKAVFGQLRNMACFCSDAKELVEWIDSRDNLTIRENHLLNDPHAVSPIQRLRFIAEKEPA